MKKTLTLLAAAAIAGPALAEDTIKIGLGVPMTGDYAPYSEWQGARCMAEMINADGGVGGKKIEVLVQDSGADTQTAISLAQKFLDEGVVMIGTIPFSDTMIPVAQVAAPYGVSIFQPQSTQVEMHRGPANPTESSPSSGSSFPSATFRISTPPGKVRRSRRVARVR